MIIKVKDRQLDVDKCHLCFIYQQINNTTYLSVKNGKDVELIPLEPEEVDDIQKILTDYECAKVEEPILTSNIPDEVNEITTEEVKPKKKKR